MKEHDMLEWAGKTAVAYRGYPIILTRRQQEVLLLLCEGLSNKMISRRLGVADATVKTHVASVLRSLNVSSRLEAVTQAFKLGLVRSRADAGCGSDGPSGLAGATDDASQSGTHAATVEAGTGAARARDAVPL